MADTEMMGLLRRLQAGDAAARGMLLQHSLERLRGLAARMFRCRNDLRTLNQTDDVLQRALVRLHKALESVHPPSVGEFFGLAARQIRWVLRDMAQELGKHRLSYGDLDPSGDGSAVPLVETGEGPADLLEWTEFHEAVEALPEEERAAFDLLVYQGLTQPEAAEVLGVSVRTLKRRWQSARLLLAERWKRSAE